MNKYSQDVDNYGSAVLKDGLPMTSDEIIEELEAAYEILYGKGGSANEGASLTKRRKTGDQTEKLMSENRD